MTILHSTGDWGAGLWGSGGWGGPSSASLTLAGALAVRENTIRLIFSQKLYFSKILDANDASDPSHYIVTPVDGSTDQLSVPTRAVNVIGVERPDSLSQPPIDQADVGKHIDILLDRPMSSFPASYLVTVDDLANEDRTQSIASAQLVFDGVYRELVKPTLETAGQLRDLASPQTESALINGMGVLATYQVAEDGDYAFDVGNGGRKKRVLRRLFTKKNGFVHLPGYGVGVGTYGKKLARLDTVGKLTTDARIQVEREPDIAKASVTADIRPTRPNLMRLHVALKPKNGRSQKFTIAVETT